MHIVESALSNPVVIAGGFAAVAGVAIGLRQLPMEKIPVAGVLAASFFVASLIHVPLGFSSVHLIMNGMAGLVLGWAAFPALFVGLLLQAVFFGFGGLTVLGVNTINIALPAVIAWYLCRRGLRHRSIKVAAIWGAIGGGMSIAITTLMVAVALALTGDEFFVAAKIVFWAHIPIMLIEALLTGAAVYLIRNVKPELFGAFEGDVQ